MDSRRAVLKYSGHIQSQYHKSKIPDPRFLPKSPEESSILDLGSATLKLNVAQYLDVALRGAILKYRAALGFNMVGLCGQEEVI